MAMHTPTTTLSANDARILNALFDPETLPSSVAKSKDASVVDTSLPPLPSISSSQLSILENRQNELVRQISSLGTEGDVSVLDAVIVELDEVVKTNPDYPSAFVNRAMARRMKLEQNIASTQTTSSSTTDLKTKATIFALSTDLTTPLFSDLSSAIFTSLPSTSSPISTYQARILRTTYSHRAYLYLKASESGIEWQGKGKSELEELASKDFAEAARYGDEKAREMSVRTNPYAKMCGAIVRNALCEERREAGMAGL